MFPFFKSSKASFNLASLGIDMHSHLIAGIDDGAKTTTDSLFLIKNLVELGYQKIITTPHIMNDYYPNTPTIIRQGLKDLKDALEAANINIEIEAAAEYYMDSQFEIALKQDAELLTFGDNHILIEQSMLEPHPNLGGVIFQLNTKGYRPILAHPERYSYYIKEFSRFEELKSYGCLFQMNLLSLTGYYGKTQQKLAQKLLKADLIDFLGTDMHHERHARKIKQMAADKYLLRHLEGKTFLNQQL